MTALELIARYVNKQGAIQAKGLTIPVKTVDVKTAYGRPRLKIVPLSGTGERWIEVFTLVEQPTKAVGSNLRQQGA